MTGLQERVLAFEKRVWSLQGNKEQAIREEVGVSPVRYYQVLAALLSDPEAIEKEPVLVHRLQRIAGRRGTR